MNQSSKTEPTAIVVSMALTALASNYADSTTLIWRKIAASLIFILAGTSTTQLYWSLIIPLLREQLDVSLTRRGKTKFEFLGQLVIFYFRAEVRFLLARCTIMEMRLLGYLNGLAAFILFFLAQFFIKVL